MLLLDNGLCCGETIVEAKLRYLLKINTEAKPRCLFSKHQTVMQAKHNIISIITNTLEA